MRWTFLDLPSWPRLPVLIGCLLLDCITSQRSLFVLHVHPYLCGALTGLQLHKYITRMVFFVVNWYGT